MIKRLTILFILTCTCIRLHAQVNIITTIAGNDTAGFRGDNELCVNAEFDHANQLCLDNFGNLYIADAFNNRVRKIVLSTGIITTVAGNGTGGYLGDGGLATDAELFIPDGVCADSLGNIYIADGLNHCIRKVEVATGIIHTIVGDGTAGNSGDGGPAISAKITSPSGLTMDKFENLYLADIDNNNVRKITPSGIITTVAGNGILGFSGDGGIATNAEFNTPSDVGVDNLGDIFISDELNQRVRKVDAVTGIVTTIAGNGTQGYSGDGGPSINSVENYPYGIFVNNQNEIFIVEGLNGVIRKINGITGVISTVVGCGIEGFSGDGGPATSAELKPDDVFIDGFGTMYIADYRNNRIRKVYNDKLGINSITNSIEISLYPNPAKNELIIEHAESNSMSIYNGLGQEVRVFKLSSSKEAINVQSLSAGIYIAHFIGANGEVKNRQFVKE